MCGSAPPTDAYVLSEVIEEAAKELGQQQEPELKTPELPATES